MHRQRISQESSTLKRTVYALFLLKSLERQGREGSGSMEGPGCKFGPNRPPCRTCVSAPNIIFSVPDRMPEASPEGAWTARGPTVSPCLSMVKHPRCLNIATCNLTGDGHLSATTDDSQIGIEGPKPWDPIMAADRGTRRVPEGSSGGHSARDASLAGYGQTSQIIDHSQVQSDWLWSFIWDH